MTVPNPLLIPAAPITLAPQTLVGAPGGVAPVLTGGSGATGGDVTLTNQIRESMMTDQIRGLLQRQGTGQPLSAAEQVALAS